MECIHLKKEYAWLVVEVRNHQNHKMDLGAAVDVALDEMPEGFVIKPFLSENIAEVKNMFLTEYNEEKVMEKERQEGAKQEREKVAAKMLKEGGMTASFISKMTEMSEEAVRKLAKTMGVFLT